MVIKLGDRVRDKITGFEGIATARVVYLNGCIQFCVDPGVNKEGEMMKGEYIDVSQLEVIEDLDDPDSRDPDSDIPPGSVMSNIPLK